MTDSAFLNVFLPGCCIVLGILILLALVRAVKGPRFTDRIVAVNLIGTITIIIMCILSVYFQQAFLVDIAIVYALLSFIAIVVLTRLVLVRRRAQMEKEQQNGLQEDVTASAAAEIVAPGLAEVVHRADTVGREAPKK